MKARQLKIGEVVAEPVWSEETARDLLKTNEEARFEALVILSSMQTPREKHTRKTMERNGVGFNQPDAKILSDLCDKHLKGVPFSSKQKAVVQRCIPKYAKQIYRDGRLEKYIH